jgi:capsular exopolysaccharide synthesis family protein
LTSASKPVRKSEIDLLEYWQIVWKRRWIVLSATAVLVALTVFFSLTSTPLYRATATLLLEEPISNRLTIQDLLSGQGVGFAESSSYRNTQLRILQSRTIAERVAKKIDLARRPELRSPQDSKQSLLQMIRGLLRMDWLFPSRAASQRNLAAEAEASSDAALRNAEFILDGLTVRPIPDTRLVEVSFVSRFPGLASDIVNTLSSEFVYFSAESRYEATQQTSEFLNDQISRLREDLATKERELQKYSEEKKILQLNEKESNVVSKYAELQKAAMSAQVERINAESRYRELSKLQIDALPQVINNPNIQALNTSYLTTRSEYEEKIRTTFTPSHPDMIQLKARVDGLKGQLEEEIKNAVAAANAVYRTALDKEQRLQRELDAQRVDVSRTNSDAILSRSLDIDISNIREMLDKLVGQQNEALVSARLSGQMTSTIKVVDSALVPKKPFSPNTKRNIIVGLLLGVFFGIGLAFVIDVLDNTVKSPEDLEKLTGLPSLGLIPHFTPKGSREKGGGYAYSYRYRSAYGPKGDAAAAELAKLTEVELINHLFPKISIAEDYRTVRTAIQFSRSELGSRAIAFTSASPQEGKSATVANMAISFAQLGDRVLIVDADLRKPRLHKIFKVRNRAGLSDVLAGRATADDAIQKTAIDNLLILPSGPHPPNPAELLNAKRMKDLLDEMRKRFATILIDLPPVLAVIDPVIVSTQADMTVIVVRMGVTTRKLLRRAIEELGRGKADIIGAILNDARIRRSSLGSSAPFFQYEYYQDKSDAESPAAKS